jgi:hypothetical protein
MKKIGELLTASDTVPVNGRKLEVSIIGGAPVRSIDALELRFDVRAFVK